MYVLGPSASPHPAAAETADPESEDRSDRSMPDDDDATTDSLADDVNTLFLNKPTG